MHVACQEKKLELLRILHRLRDTDPEGLFDIYIRRLTDEDWGIRQWTGDLKHQLRDELSEIESSPPEVNGEVLYEPDKTLGEEYRKLIEKAPESKPNLLIKKEDSAK